MAKNLILWVIIALVIIYSLELMNETTSEARNNYVAFKNELVSDQIRSVKINGKIITGEKTLTEELEQLFGEDKISMCRKILKGNSVAGM